LQIWHWTRELSRVVALIKGLRKKWVSLDAINESSRSALGDGTVSAD
jgi:hypothetical protein